MESSGGTESNTAIHKAWVVSLVPLPEAPLTPVKVERDALIGIDSLRDGTLTGERIAAARDAHILIG